MRILITLNIFFFTALMCNAESKSEKPNTGRDVECAMAGTQLNADQAAKLESLVGEHPDDAESRCKLLGYYFLAKHSQKDAREAAQKHALWFIKNKPDSEIAGSPYCGLNLILDSAGYGEAKQLWLDNTKPATTQPVVLGNAARFFFIHDAAQAESLFERAAALEPKNPTWRDQLAHLHSLQRRKDSAIRALIEFEKADAVDTNEESKFARLDSLAKTAFDAEDLDKATRYAEQLLKAGEKHKDSWNYGNAVHHGNNVLGRIALEKGDTQKAKEYLLKAGDTPGSPQLNSFGPNMSLAKELLEAGEKETVLQYFKRCGTFWTSERDRLATWTKQVESGETPEFGANLVY